MTEQRTRRALVLALLLALELPPAAGAEGASTRAHELSWDALWPVDWSGDLAGPGAGVDWEAPRNRADLWRVLEHDWALRPGADVLDVRRAASLFLQRTVEGEDARRVVALSRAGGLPTRPAAVHLAAAWLEEPDRIHERAWAMLLAGEHDRVLAAMALEACSFGDTDLSQRESIQEQLTQARAAAYLHARAAHWRHRLANERFDAAEAQARSLARTLRVPHDPELGLPPTQFGSRVLFGSRAERWRARVGLEPSPDIPEYEDAADRIEDALRRGAFEAMDGRTFATTFSFARYLPCMLGNVDWLDEREQKARDDKLAGRWRGVHQDLRSSTERAGTRRP